MPAFIAVLTFVAVYAILRLTLPHSPDASDIYRNHP